MPVFRLVIQEDVKKTKIIEVQAPDAKKAETYAVDLWCKNQIDFGKAKATSFDVLVCQQVEGEEK